MIQGRTCHVQILPGLLSYFPGHLHLQCYSFVVRKGWGWRQRTVE